MLESLQRVEIEIGAARTRHLAKQADKSRALQQCQLPCRLVVTRPIGVMQGVGSGLCVQRDDARLPQHQLRGRSEQNLPDRVGRDPATQKLDDAISDVLRRGLIQGRAQLGARTSVIAAVFPGGRNPGQELGAPAPRPIRHEIVAGGIRICVAV